MRPLWTSVLGGLVVASATLAQDLPAGDPDKGRRVANMCRACHGLDGFTKIVDAPHIGGESSAYLAAQLSAFRRGARNHAMMSVVSRGLSDHRRAHR